MISIFGVDISEQVLVAAAKVVVIGVGTILIASLVRRLFNRLLGKAPERAVKGVSRLLQLVIYIVGLLAVLAALNIDVSSVLISLGAASIAVSFALSTLINNLVAGFLIQADGSVRVGDNVSFGGIDGRVVRMRTRALMVVTKEGSIVFVPNAYFMSNPVINRGRDTGH
jgi:small conductance mechanosensitive channel